MSDTFKIFFNLKMNSSPPIKIVNRSLPRITGTGKDYQVKDGRQSPLKLLIAFSDLQSSNRWSNKGAATKNVVELCVFFIPRDVARGFDLKNKVSSVRPTSNLCNQQTQT